MNHGSDKEEEKDSGSGSGMTQNSSLTRRDKYLKIRALYKCPEKGKFVKS